MVAEGAVVGVFLDGHELDDVVAGGGDAGEDGFRELAVGVDAGFLAAHADVGFVDAWGVDGGGVEGVLPVVFCGRVPDLAGVVVGDGVLDGAEDGGGDAVAA